MKRLLLFASVAVAAALAFLIAPAAASAKAGASFKSARLAQAKSASVEVRFDLSAPQGGPFPADRVTVPDPSQLTGLRVDLPTTGLDCTADPRPSDCNDVNVLNVLDGFNLQPRLSIPFTGPIDPASVSSENVFVFKLACLIATCPGDSRVGINQVVWDPATNTLY